ncbi:MAG: hypothetical protein GEV12_22700 [Micromonosporaceae bacterium]|nr:hypothetical protein [Micromonosporaceae bacterium]
MTQIWRSRRRTTAVAVLAGAIALTTGCTAEGDLISYELPPEPGRYTLEVETGGVTTVWEYTSERPIEDKFDRSCLADALGNPDAPPCRPEPLIFLRYELALDLDDTVPARRPHEITVTSYYQPQPGAVPTVTDLAVEASFDGGATWQSMRTQPAGEAGSFATTIRPPATASGVVALRVSATDSDGNSVVQTIPEAYRLK